MAKEKATESRKDSPKAKTSRAKDKARELPIDLSPADNSKDAEVRRTRLKNLIALERQAYDVGAEKPGDDRSQLTEEELDRRIAKLAGQG